MRGATAFHVGVTRAPHNGHWPIPGTSLQGQAGLAALAGLPRPQLGLPFRAWPVFRAIEVAKRLAFTAPTWRLPSEEVPPTNFLFPVYQRQGGPRLAISAPRPVPALPAVLRPSGAHLSQRHKVLRLSETAPRGVEGCVLKGRPHGVASWARPEHEGALETPPHAEALRSPSLSGKHPASSGQLQVQEETFLSLASG